MSGYSEYSELMVDWASAYMKPIFDRHQKGTLTEPSKHKVFNAIFYGFTEITNAFDALRLYEVLISVAPPRSRRIKNDEYIKHLINSYLQEVYILKERLHTYATKVKRLHERAGRKTLVAQHIDPLFGFVKASLDGIVSTRGAHVHSNRYSDAELDDVTEMALISKYNPEFESHYKFSYKKARGAWLSRIKTNNEATEKLLDHYFDSISQVVKENGSVFMP